MLTLEDQIVKEFETIEKYKNMNNIEEWRREKSIEFHKQLAEWLMDYKRLLDKEAKEGWKYCPLCGTELVREGGKKK